MNRVLPKRPSGAVLAIVACGIILIWALNFIAVKVGLRYLPPLTLASLRVILAAIALLPVYLLRSHLATSGPLLIWDFLESRSTRFALPPAYATRP